MKSTTLAKQSEAIIIPFDDQTAKTPIENDVEVEFRGFADGASNDMALHYTLRDHEVDYERAIQKQRCSQARSMLWSRGSTPATTKGLHKVDPTHDGSTQSDKACMAIRSQEFLGKEEDLPESRQSMVATRVLSFRE